MKSEGDAALEVARTQQEADRAVADIKQAWSNIKLAEAFKPRPQPEPEPLSKDAVYFQASAQDSSRMHTL